MRGTASTADVRRVIRSILAPYLGEGMADATVRGYIAKLAPEVKAITTDECRKLVQWMAPGLNVFVGDARACRVISELETELARLLEEA